MKTKVAKRKIISTHETATRLLTTRPAKLGVRMSVKCDSIVTGERTSIPVDVAAACVSCESRESRRADEIEELRKEVLACEARAWLCSSAGCFQRSNRMY